MQSDQQDQLSEGQEERGRPQSSTKPFKNMKGMPPGVRLLNPQTLPWGILLLLIYLILVIFTREMPENLISQIIASIRLLFLTMGLFFSLMGILGLITHPEDKSKAIPKLPSFLKRKIK
ncbi:MAG: hypothetical protein EAX86_04025 [Candidatus Heimdallarchaeota archaeon]|nr:hypothetical protein [Candidatus Heimdallarchaeota archaeon]